ncbi:MAG: glycosyltransferase family 4 protein [Bifidobacteriaceae bacterium]|jgi:glycosyltransferase involved in cell wall biosynthesis|nr:glycosyltransferase family 4 protein [Bifidobacteriaceae bacterium]
MNQPHIVMVVPNAIEHDARVRREALSAQAAGFRVTLLWANLGGPKQPVEGDIGGVVKTLGVPLNYVLRNRQVVRRAALAGWFPTWRYWERDAFNAAAQAAQVRKARAAAGGTVGLAVNKGAQLVFKVRSHFYRGHQAKATQAGQAKPYRWPVNWRRYLAAVRDMDAAFTGTIAALEPDLIHCNDIYSLNAGFSAQAVLRRRGRHVPVVYDAHEFVAAYDRLAPKLKAAYVAMEKDLAPKAAGVVTVSEPIADAMQRDLHLAARPVVVHNAPPLGGGDPSQTTLRQVTGLAPDVPLLVYSGVIQPQRNVEGAIKALPLLPGVHLAVICVPSPQVPLAQGLARLAEAEGVADRVHLVDPVPPTQIAAYIADATLGIDPMDTHFPQHQVALPNKLFDYLHAGLPVALSSNQAEKQFAEEYGVGTVFDPDDPADIARAVQAALDRHDELVRHIAESGVVQQFSWDGQVKGLLGLYRDLLGSEAK